MALPPKPPSPPAPPQRAANGHFLPGNQIAAGNKGSDGPPAPRMFDGPTQLWAAFVAYMAHLEANPLKEEQVFSAREGIRRTTVAKMRAPTWAGFSAFLDISPERFREWKRDREDLQETLQKIDAVFFSHKFEGAAAGLLNAGIIARELGLADKREIAATIAPPPPPPQNTRHIANLIHPDDPDPLGENRPLFSQAQLEARIPFFEPKR